MIDSDAAWWVRYNDLYGQDLDGLIKRSAQYLERNPHDYHTRRVLINCLLLYQHQYHFLMRMMRKP